MIYIFQSVPIYVHLFLLSREIVFSLFNIIISCSSYICQYYLLKDLIGPEYSDLKAHT